MAKHYAARHAACEEDSTLTSESLTEQPLVAEYLSRHNSAQPADRSSWLRQGVFGLLSLVLIGGTLVFAGLSKSVTLVIDGHGRTVSTYGARVSDVVRDADVPVDSKDIVAPLMSQSVKSGGTVTVTHARPVTITIDGQTSTKMVAALTVQDALQQLGLDDYGVSASRSLRLSTSGASLALSSPKAITITVDGATDDVITTATTAKEAIQQAGIAIADTDQISPSADAAVSTGMAIAVTRVSEATITEVRDVPFTLSQQPNPDQYIGINSTLTPGVNGQSEFTVLVKSTDGVQTSRIDLASSVMVAPVTKVQSIGAKDFPANVNALNWQALAKCESTNNPKAVNLTNHKYFGMYQFSLATWASVGGSGNPVDATPEEQLARAKLLYIRSGAGQWECGSHLSD